MLESRSEHVVSSVRFLAVALFAYKTNGSLKNQWNSIQTIHLKSLLKECEGQNACVLVITYWDTILCFCSHCHEEFSLLHPKKVARAEVPWPPETRTTPPGDCCGVVWVGLQGLGEVALSTEGREEEFGRTFSENKKGRTEGFYGFQRNDLAGLLVDWEEWIPTPDIEILCLSNDLQCSSLAPRQCTCPLRGRLGQWA